MRTYDCNRHTTLDRQAAVGSAFAARTAKPVASDLRSICPPIYDQGALGACTGFAVAKGLLEILRIRARIPAPGMSALYLYYWERACEHDVADDAGAQIVDGLYVLSRRGCATDQADPYHPDRFASPPLPDAEAEAPSYRVAGTSHLHSPQDMWSCLDDGFPFVGGIDIFESFESDQVANTGLVPMPGPGEKLLGGHAVCIVGLDPAQNRFLVRNSWGAGWGLNGYFWLPAQYLYGHGSDFWTARL